MSGVEEEISVFPLPTEKEIMSFQHFHEAVVLGGMDEKYYAKLCAMARYCREVVISENEDG